MSQLEALRTTHNTESEAFGPTHEPSPDSDIAAGEAMPTNNTTPELLDTAEASLDSPEANSTDSNPESPLPPADKLRLRATKAEAKIAELEAQLNEQRGNTVDENETSAERTARAGKRLRSIGRGALTGLKKMSIGVVGFGVLHAEKGIRQARIGNTQLHKFTQQKLAEHGKKAADRVEARIRNKAIPEAYAMDAEFNAQVAQTANDNFEKSLKEQAERALPDAYAEKAKREAMPEAYAMNAEIDKDAIDASFKEQAARVEDEAYAEQAERQHAIDIRREIAEQDAREAAQRKAARRARNPLRRISRFVGGLGPAISTAWKKTAQP